MLFCRRCHKTYPILPMMAQFTYWICYARDALGRRCMTMNVRNP